VALAVSLVVLVAALAAAVARHQWAPGSAVAAAGALLLLALGIAGAHEAADAIRALGPTVGFLGALLVLADGCRREGLFEALGAALARGSNGDERRLLALVFAAATAVTVALGLDATAVLLTPVVLVCAARLRASPRAPAYACVHLANSASLLLPVSNLTNLLAFRAAGVSFAHFAVLMLLPTAWAVAVDWLALKRLVPSTPPSAARPAADRRTADRRTADPAPMRSVPRFALAVLVLTLAGFLASSLISIAPVWIATGGAVLITLPALRRPAATARELVTAVQPGFLVFVLGLAVIVAAAGDHGLRHAVSDILPGGSGLPALLLIAAVAAVLANLLNNLPATLLLLPLAGAHGVGPVLAVLVGVNVGPNLTEVGSLATLLWRRALADGGVHLDRREFAALGALTVPPALAGATVLLWLALRVVG
jgi:arsenical pump membrane protein